MVMPKYIEQKYSDVINRIKKMLNVRNDAEVARAMDVSPASLSEFKKKQRIPTERLVQLCLTKGINIRWLLAGEGNMYESIKMTELGAEPLADYGPDKDFQHLIDELRTVFYEGTTEERGQAMGIIGSLSVEIKRKRGTDKREIDQSDTEKRSAVQKEEKDMRRPA